ncbi:MAG: SAM-dependent methyltransferase [Gammaproteobacteria bacterium]|nr:SAM-dependent methyltransferase [Gammaproteobacteria bacterium]MDH4310859.1 SAM-dependent methyltransferase [Gammaproteobacteria bacterium]MDH5272272.1 SAM-dependent methyltransferase [Gammaproteobacteria bacterium]
MTVPLDLPELTPEEAAHSAALTERIHAVITAEGGWIGFDRFMQLALYEPGLGYYSAGARKFGAAGDFITAPEVAPVFSRCLALQCADVLRELGPESCLLELGAGSGAMAADLLAELERQGALPAAYWILDLSADLRERQRETLERQVPHLLSRVQWLDSLPDAPFAGMILANEVLDALTVERFTIRSGEVNALGVSSEFGQLRLAEVRAASRLVAAVRGIEADTGIVLPDGYESEVCAGLARWFESIAFSLERGVLLFIDYGLPRREYYSAERTRGTLLCHFRHRFHEDALTRVGLQDITAWVDFTAVASAAQAAGCEVAGYTTQAHFLLGCGLGDFLANVAGLEPAQRLTSSRQAMVLTLPGEMGERFKVIALAKNYDSPLRGFAVRDLRHTL